LGTFTASHFCYKESPFGPQMCSLGLKFIHLTAI